VIKKIITAFLLVLANAAFSETEFVFPEPKSINPLFDCAVSKDPVDLSICKKDYLKNLDYYFYKVYLLRNKNNQVGFERTSQAYYEFRDNLLISATPDFTEMGSCDDACFLRYSLNGDLAQLYEDSMSELFNGVDINEQDLREIKNEMLSLWGLNDIPTDLVERFFYNKHQDLALREVTGTCVNASFSVLYQSNSTVIYKSFGSACRGMGSSINISLACNINNNFQDVKDEGIELDKWKDYGNFEAEINMLLNKTKCQSIKGSRGTE
jgi:uncharacterized protein